MLTALIIVLAVVALVVVVGGGALLVGPRRRGRRARPEAAPPARELRRGPATGPTVAGPSPGPGRQQGAVTRPPRAAPAQPPRPPREVPPGPVAEAPEAPEAHEAPDVAPVAEAAPMLVERPRFRDRLGKARAMLSGSLAGLRGRSKLDQEAWDELEEALVLADVGVATTEALLAELRQRAREEGFSEPAQLVAALRESLVRRLEGDRELHRAEDGRTTVWLFVGVNGVGKTTTIGKVAMREVSAGADVVMAAGDTFRAAAADQLKLWSERAGAGFVRGNEGGDPGAVVFDAVQHAAARGTTLVLADTAGRLHTKVNLMEELKKVRRVADRPPGAVTEVLLVLDATTGQNGLVQARQFTEAVGVTGVVLTKLDGTAKGGIAVAITSELGIPLKLVGLGEGPEDLVVFDPKEFVEALLPAEGD